MSYGGRMLEVDGLKGLGFCSGCWLTGVRWKMVGRVTKSITTAGGKTLALGVLFFFLGKAAVGGEMK